MAGIWKAHVEWIDEAGLESKNEFGGTKDLVTSVEDGTNRSATPRVEKLVIGWSGTIWIINVHRERENAAVSKHPLGRAEVVTM